MSKKGGAPPMPGNGPEELPPVPYGKLLRWGWIVVRGALGSFSIATALGIVNLVIQQLGAQLLGAITARLSALGMAGSAKKAGGDLLSALVPESPLAAFELLVALTVIGVGTILAERATTTWSDTVMLARLQRRLHDRLLELGPSYHAQHASGETTTIVWRYANGAQMLLRDLVAFPVVRGVGLATALVLLFQNLARLGDTPVVLKLVLLGGVLLTPIVSARGAKGLRSAFQKVRASDVAANEELQNSLAAPLEVQLMGAIPQRSKAFGDRAMAHARNRLRASMRNDLMGQARSSIPRMLQLGFLGYGIYLASASGDPMAVGAVVTINALVPLTLQPLTDLVMFWSSIGMAWPECESVIEILERKADVDEPTSPEPLPEGKAPIFLEDVVFTYPGRAKPVLDHVSFSFTAGKCVAIVGASGSGKSTILSLVARLSDPVGGRVKIGDTDLRKVRLADLRKKVVRVAQFPLFVADTVRANFQLAKADATDAEIRAVCEATGLWDVLTTASPERPLDTILPRDVAQGLSGGQRRLLAVSRALLLEPTVLLLDEPSAGLDNLTLQKLIRFLRTQTSGLTVLVIDHDLEGFVSKIADKIAILADGKIALAGTHEELMQTDNLYRRLVEAPNEEKVKAEPPPPKAPALLEGMLLGGADLPMMGEIDMPMMAETDMPMMKSRGPSGGAEARSASAEAAPGVGVSGAKPLTMKEKKE